MRTPRKAAAPKPKLHPTQGAAPVIEPDDNGPTDVVMPTAENQAYLFRPQAGTTMLDFREIVLMGLIQMMSDGPQVQPGALRQALMSGERFNQLSPEAQRWMKPVTAPPPEDPDSQETP